MELFELSMSPYLNDVIRSAENCYNSPDETGYRELAASLSTMAEFSQILTHTFSEAMKVRPKTVLTKQAPHRFEVSLGLLTGALHTIKSYLKDHNRDLLPKGVADGREAVKSMFGLFEELKQEEEAFPIFSESPYIQELVRIATGVAKGEYGADTLKAKLEWMQNRYREFVDDFASLKDSPRETEEVDKLLPIAEKALVSMGRSLQELAVYMNDRNRDHLKSGCASLLKSSEILIAVQSRLMKISTAQPAACPKCSALNPGGAKTCHNCGATLPEIVGLSKQTIEIKEDTEANQRPTFTYLARLEGAVESALQGGIAKSELKKQIDFFAQKAKTGRTQFEALKPPENFEDEQSRELAASSYRLMDQGTRTTLEGVTQLERYLTSEAREDLENGLKLVQQGADSIIAAQQLMLSAGVKPQ